MSNESKHTDPEWYHDPGAKTTPTKHTPGPWTCHSGSVYVDGPNVHPKGPETGTPIAHMDREYSNGTEPVERDANAALIAAAPDLLDIAAAALNWWHDNDANFERKEPAFIKLAHKSEITRTAAIAKAEKD